MVCRCLPPTRLMPPLVRISHVRGRATKLPHSLPNRLFSCVVASDRENTELPRSGGVICIHETQQRLYDRVEDVKLNYVVQKKKKRDFFFFFLETVHTSR
ncbi:unnamed protein product [Ixodes pacificus]